MLVATIAVTADVHASFSKHAELTLDRQSGVMKGALHLRVGEQAEHVRLGPVFDAVRVPDQIVEFKHILASAGTNGNDAMTLHLTIQRNGRAT